MSQTVLITGGAGYFGSLLVARIKERGMRCRIFDISNDVDCDPDVEFIQGDIRDYEAVLAACQGVSVVHHNVAQVPLAKDDALFRSVNYQGVENILRGSLSSQVQKVVYTSSSAIFGVPKYNPVTELSLPSPGESYGQAKYDGELLCNDFIAQGLDVSIIRPRTIMGHGRLGIFQILFEWIYNGQNVPVFDKGDNIYQFVHADDLALACIHAGELAGPSVFNCGASRFGTMREVLEDLCQYAGTGSVVKSIPMKPAVFGMTLTSKLGFSPLGSYHALMYGKSMYFDISKAKSELNWSPKYSNNQMFRESYDWYVKNRDRVMSSKGSSHHRSPVKQGILRLVGKIL